MKKCNSCDIEYNTNYKRCPLCNSELSGNNSSLYPKYKTIKTSLTFRIILFISILISIIVVFTDYKMNNTITWSKYVLLLLLINLVIEHTIFINKKHVLNKLSNIGIFIIVLSLIWYLVTKHKVMINIFIPIISIIEILYNSFLVFILRKNYIKNLIINLFLISIPLVIFILKYNSYNLFYFILFILGIIVIVALIIFKYRYINSELKKIFRI